MKPRGKCIFCDGFGLSKEHLMPDWLKAYIPRKHTRFETVLAVHHPGSTDRSTRLQLGDPHVKKLRCVCKTCNNGWMSVLQQKAQPILIPLLRGEPTFLNRKQQAIVAAWIAMAVMVAEFGDRRSAAVSALEYDPKIS